MSIFARRRLQSMLNDISTQLTSEYLPDLLARLDNPDTKSAIAAEFELALLWGMAEVADVKIGPKIGASRPDALATNLFDSGAALIEITALSDYVFSGQADMDRAANIIVQFADRTRKGSGKHLNFVFAERSWHENNRFHRIRRVTPDFSLTQAMEDTIRTWLKKSDWPTPIGIRLYR